MKCDLELLEDFVEGFLGEAEQKKMEAHLQSCENCQIEYEQLLNEQNVLLTQLNLPKMANSQYDVIVQRIQKDNKHKKYWQTFKVFVISAAIILLSFALYYSNQTPKEVAQPIEDPTRLVESINSKQKEHIESEQVLNYNEPFLDVSIDKVVENGDNIDIHYRVKFKEQYQRIQDDLYEQHLKKYLYVEVANVPRIDDAQDDFFGIVGPKVYYAIRDETGQLINATKRIEGEEPLIPEFGGSGSGTDVLGEMIFTTSVPKQTKPATFEVLQMEARVFNVLETEVNTSNLQPFQLNNVTYTIDSLEIKQGVFHLIISTEGKPKVELNDWKVEINKRLIGSNEAKKEFINNRTVYKLQFENFEQIPTNFILMPFTVKVKKQINPIVLDLH